MAILHSEEISNKIIWKKKRNNIKKIIHMSHFMRLGGLFKYVGNHTDLLMC